MEICNVSFRVAKFLDYDAGSLLLLTEDFSEEVGEIVAVRPGFSWWVSGDRRIIGFSIDGIDHPEALDRDFLQAQHFRVSVPQFRLANASVYEVAAAARMYFVDRGNGSFVGEAYRRASQVHDSGDLTDKLNDWLCLYHVYGHTDGLFWMGCIFLEMGMPAEALRWLGKYARLHPGDSWGQCSLGNAYYLVGDYVMARKHLRLSLAATPADGEPTDAGLLLSVLDGISP